MVSRVLYMAIVYTKSKRIESLDTIRGLAALSVLFGHTMGVFDWPNSLASWTRFPVVNMLFDGLSGVAMFFVLSGFVLSRPYLAPTPVGQTPRQLFVPTFYIRRITRIWIPWFCVFCLSAVLRAYLYHPYDTIPPMSEWIGRFWHVPLTLSSFLRQCAFALHDPQRLLLPQDWSLGVELKGSALIPVFLFLVRRHILYLVGAGVLLFVCLPNAIEPYYVSFVLGVIAARYHDAIEAKMRRLTFASKCGILAFGILLYQSRLVASHFLAGSLLVDHVVWCICSIGCVFIITTSVASNRIQRALSHGVLVFLGKISYSVYLLQLVVLLCVLPPLVYGLNRVGIQNTLVLMPLANCIAVLLTVATAAFTYRIVELPSIEFGHWISTFIQRRFLKTPKTPKLPKPAV